jgi:hypothetical protein
MTRAPGRNRGARVIWTRWACAGPRFDVPQSPLSRTPFNHANIRANRKSLDHLADALRDPGPRPIRGLAMASALVKDKGGPLYVNDSVEQVKGVVRATISALN